MHDGWCGVVSGVRHEAIRRDDPADLERPRLGNDAEYLRPLGDSGNERIDGLAAERWCRRFQEWAEPDADHVTARLGRERLILGDPEREHRSEDDEQGLRERDLCYHEPALHPRAPRRTSTGVA